MYFFQMQGIKLWGTAVEVWNLNWFGPNQSTEKTKKMIESPSWRFRVNVKRAALCCAALLTNTQTHCELSSPYQFISSAGRTSPRLFVLLFSPVCISSVKQTHWHRISEQSSRPPARQHDWKVNKSAINSWVEAGPSLTWIHFQLTWFKITALLITASPIFSLPCIAAKKKHVKKTFLLSKWRFCLSLLT